MLTDVDKETNSRESREKEHFNKLLMEEGTCWWGHNTSAGRERIKMRGTIFKEFIKPSQNTKVLEIGCGDGQLTKEIADWPCKIIAVDISEEAVARARTRLGSLKNIEIRIEEIGRAHV
jgi:2-polyprenyl-3-methyl-5-hydroxy-6-metoxy-1,4-benzoquinol methylase